MSRYCYNDVVRDQNGAIVADATIVVYVCDTTTAATIYSAKSGGSAVSGASLTAASDGTFSFYVDDSNYESGAQFDLKISKAGYTTKYVYDVHVF